VPLTSSEPRLYYEEHGAGEPVLLITGFGFSSAVLEPLIVASRDAPRWITYDHPATGRSSKRAFTPTTAALARSAARVLDELELETATIAGASLGGAIALELALRFPDRVRSLILMSTTAAGPLGRKTNPLQLAGIALRIGAGSLPRQRLWLAPAVFSSEFLRREPERTQELMRLFGAHPPTLWGVLGQYVAAGLHNRAGRLHEVQAPTLVLHGERDVLVPVSNAEQLATGIKQAELHVFPDTGHAFGLECPEQTVIVICEWLARQSPTP
jgi:3-oxoadipate enol-lactonase